MRTSWILAASLVALSGCAPARPALHRVVETPEILVVVEQTAKGEGISHAIFAQPQGVRSGAYTRLDMRKVYDCETGRSQMKDVSGFTAEGKRISTVSGPDEWKTAQGAGRVELRIVCDREFAATRKLDGDLAAIEAAYRGAGG